MARVYRIIHGSGSVAAVAIGSRVAALLFTPELRRMYAPAFKGAGEGGFVGVTEAQGQIGNRLR